MDSLVIPISILSCLALLSGIVFFTRKRNKSLLPAIIYLLLMLLAFGGLGLIASLVDAGPRKVYLMLQLAFLLLGVIHLWCLASWHKFQRISKELLFTALLAFLGGIVFLLANTYFSPDTHGMLFLSSLLPFVIPFLLIRAFSFWKQIPIKVFSIWQYVEQLQVPDLVPGETINLTFRISRDTEEQMYSKFTIRAPLNMKVGELFHYFLFDYNEQHNANPILANVGEDPFGWFFYTKAGWWKKRQTIDPYLSVYRNLLKNNNIVIAKRISLDHLN